MALGWLLVLDFAGSPAPDVLQILFGKVISMQRANATVVMARQNTLVVMARENLLVLMSRDSE